MLEIEHLTKVYPGMNVPAIQDVSFGVKKGEILGFLGPNGAGKTTTMRIITGFMPATSGKVTVGGYDVFDHSMEARRLIGYLPENAPLYEDMRVEEYLHFRAKIKGVPRRERKKRVDEVIEKCWIGDVRKKVIGQLSKGYRQRVGIADALVHNPKVLILDEPTIGLDPNQVRQVRRMIKELGGEHTILLSSHILPEVEMVSNRVVIINKGRVVAEDKPENLSERLRGGSRVVVELKGPEKAIVEGVSKIDGVKSVLKLSSNGFDRFEIEVEKGHDVREEIYRLASSNGWVLRELHLERVSLEDVFVHLTTSEEVE